MRHGVLILTLLVLVTGPAFGVTYIVAPDGSGDFPTIQAAIDAATTDDIIKLADGTFLGVGNVDLDYSGKAITIRSVSGIASACVIDCEDAAGGFRLTTWEGSGSVLQDITVTNGAAANGAAVYCDGSSPTISGCVFSANDVTADGGALHCTNGASPVLTDCSFTTNTADNNGGAVYADDNGTPSFADCSFADNDASTSGGAFYLIHCTVEFDNCDFSANTAVIDGGALTANSSEIELTDCVLSSNTGRHGGGLHFATDNSSTSFAATLTGCTFTDNHCSQNGGALYTESAAYTLIACTFGDNEAVGNGGALHSEDTNTTASAMAGCTLYGNSASGNGGALYLFAIDLTISASTMYDNSASSLGGGIYCQSGNPVISNTIIAFSSDGEALSCEAGGPTLACCDIFGNEGGDWVGGIGGQYGIDGNISEDPLFCVPDNANLHLHNGSACAPFEPPNAECDLIGAWPVDCGPVTHVVKPDGSGDFPTIQAAVDASLPGDTIELSNGMFTGEGNRDIDYLGKAIIIRSQSENPDSCLIGCAYSGRGFVFHFGEGNDSVLEGVTIAYGYAGHAEDGGGILCDSSSPSIVNCVVRNCTAFRGGGIRIIGSESAPYIDGCSIDSNSADLHGGGIYSAGSPTLRNCTIVDNAAAEHGGGVRLSDGIPVVQNCTFVGNGGIAAIAYGFQEPVTFLGVIVAFSVEGKAMCSTMGPDVTPTLICCDLFGNPGGDWVDQIADQYGTLGNISANPLFCDFENRNLALHEDSPCAPFSPPNPGCDQIGAWPVGCAPMGVPESSGRPTTLLLGRSTPNPFTHTTRLAYSVPGAITVPVTLAVHDLSGRFVRLLVNSDQAPGTRGMTWDGTDPMGARVPGGVYFYRLRVGGESVTRRVLVVR